jgi:tyrosyl-tRNA synthetase
LSDTEVELLAAEIPTAGIGGSVLDLLTGAGLTGSKGEARRLLQGGGISVNGTKITEDVTINEKSLVKKGKNSFLLVK